MALSPCGSVVTDRQGRELTAHGTPLFPAACYRDDISEAAVPWHWHDELEFLVVEAGAARAAVTGAERIVRRGEGFFINAGVPHGIRPEGPDACRLRSVVFHPQRAAELLASTDRRVSDIGGACGFQEMSYFARTFRGLKGCTPKEYRLKARA